MSSKIWVFTINNYTQDDIDAIANTWLVRYVIYGKEVAETGTPHLQGYLELNTKQRLSWLKKNLHPTAYFAKRIGTQEQAINYCKEDGDWIERGEKLGICGARTDLDRVRMVAQEEDMRTVCAQFNQQQIRVAEKFLTYNETPRDWKPLVIWIWGPTGTGKSKLARELVNMDDCYTKNDGTKWWDGYDAHEDVIIDDFRDSWWSLTEMLSLLDRYEKRVEYKGGWRQFKPLRIIITSAKDPESCYYGVGECIKQLLRRIDEVKFCPLVP